MSDVETTETIEALRAMVKDPNLSIEYSPVLIVAARLLQGLFGAALVPLAQVVLMQINPREKQGSAMAVWGMGVMVGPILGPTLGGWLTDSYNWRWVFFINVPIGIIAFYGMWRYIRPDPGGRHARLDRKSVV